MDSIFEAHMITVGNIPGESPDLHTSGLKLNTGKALNEWLAMVDRWDGDKRKLQTVTNYLKQQHQLDDEWAQVIALNYLWKRL